MKHVIAVIVENKSGVLTRIAGLFSRRSFNIDSLSVGATDNPDYSRMTISVHGDRDTLEQVIKQLSKLINVIRVSELDPADSLERELAIIKVSVDRESRSEVIQIVDIFRAKIIDVSQRSMIIEVTGDEDKVEAMIQLGWSVPYYGIGDLVEYMNKVSDADIDALVKRYEAEYDIKWGADRAFALSHIREQARIETAMRRFFEERDINAFTTNFQDLHGMKQLPGLACQRLMADGYGFAGEGDWKTAAMVRTFKVMSAGLSKGEIGKGDSFMEDYTYHFEPGNEMNLGAHMLEVCPSIAAGKPTLEVHQLGIGGREDPARLVFDGKSGPAICAAVVDFGSRFRCVINEVNVVDAPAPFPKLPVARVLWKPEPNLRTSAEAWILAGGGHHTAFSNILTTDMIRDWAEISGIECIAIDRNTDVRRFRDELRWNAATWSK